MNTKTKNTVWTSENLHLKTYYSIKHTGRFCKKTLNFLAPAGLAQS